MQWLWLIEDAISKLEKKDNIMDKPGEEDSGNIDVKPNPDDQNNENLSVNTGNQNALGLYIGIWVLSLLGISSVISRKKKEV